MSASSGWAIGSKPAWACCWPPCCILLFVAILLHRLWRLVWRGPRDLARLNAERKRQQGYRALSQGMAAVAAGDAVEARRQAKIANAMLKDPPLTLLLAAQTAQLGGDEDAARRYFTAMLERPETSFLGLRGLLDAGDEGGRPGGGPVAGAARL